MTTTEKLTTREAIAKVLAGSRKPMSVAAITEAALPLTKLAGKTPKQTFYSVLYGENRKADGLVVKVGPGGTFKLNPKRRKAPRRSPRRRSPRPSEPRAEGSEGPREGPHDRAGRRGLVTRFTVLLEVRRRGACVGSTEDVVEARDTTEAEELAIAAWRALRPG